MRLKRRISLVIVIIIVTEIFFIIFIPYLDKRWKKTLSVKSNQIKSTSSGGEFTENDINNLFVTSLKLYY